MLGTDYVENKIIQKINIDKEWFSKSFGM